MKKVSDYAQSSHHFAGNFSARNISPHSKKPVWRVLRHQWTTFVMWGSDTDTPTNWEVLEICKLSFNKEKCQIALPELTFLGDEHAANG